MLKVFGTLYGNSPEGFEAMKTVLEANGFEVAYLNEVNGTVIKDVESLHESDNKES